MIKSIKVITILFLMLPFSCKKEKDLHYLTGKWKVLSKHYRATILITNSTNQLSAQYLYYNDDIKKYKFDNDKKLYLFQNLELNTTTKVDAKSGATNTNKQIQITEKHKDTLIIISKIKNKTIKETWIKTN